jgi:hypothetical protein
MAMPALKFETETPVEERTARLETHIEHMRSDISDLKVDGRRLSDKIDEIDKRLSGKIDSLKDSMDKGFSAMQVSRVWDRVWFLLTAAAMFGVMARGFKWI